MHIAYYLATAWTIAALAVTIQSHFWFKEQQKGVPTGLGIYILASCIFGIIGLMSMTLY